MKILPKISETASPDEVIKQMNDIIEQLNFIGTNASFTENFDCQLIKNISIAAGATVVVPHKLGIIPPFRFIIRQEGNGVVSDVPSAWTDKTISLINNGAVTVTISILLARE